MRPVRLLPLAAAAAALWYARTVYRFRDPVRVVNAEPTSVLSPADGMVCFVRRVSSGQVDDGQGGAPLRTSDLLGRAVDSGWLLGLFVGPLDVHYTFQPLNGEIVAVVQPDHGENVPLLGAAALAGVLAGRAPEQLSTRALQHNERLSMTTRSDLGEVTVTLVAPGSGLHAASYLHTGDPGRAGHKSAFVPGGGLALLLVPEALTPLVSVGDRVVATRTVIARS